MSEKELAAHAFLIQFGSAARHKGRTYMRKILLFAQEDRAVGHALDYQAYVSRTALICKVTPSAIISAIDRWVRHSWTQDSATETWCHVVGLGPMGTPPTPVRAIHRLCEAYLAGPPST